MTKNKHSNKKKINFFKNNYAKSWKFIKEIKVFIWVIIALFFVFALIGFFVPINPDIEKTLLDYIKEILSKTEGMSQFDLISFIFFNNLQSSFFGLIFGFVLGIFPVFSTLVNGYVLGYVSSMAVSSDGLSSLLSLLPHGIFELPAVFISLAMGLKLGTFIFYKKKMDTFSRFLTDSIRVFVFVVLPLLIIAAIIEGSLIFLIK